MLFWMIIELHRSSGLFGVIGWFVLLLWDEGGLFDPWTCKTPFLIIVVACFLISNLYNFRRFADAFEELPNLSAPWPIRLCHFCRKPIRLLFFFGDMPRPISGLLSSKSSMFCLNCHLFSILTSCKYYLIGPFQSNPQRSKGVIQFGKKMGMLCQQTIGPLGPPWYRRNRSSIKGSRRNVSSKANAKAVLSKISAKPWRTILQQHLKRPEKRFCSCNLKPGRQRTKLVGKEYLSGHKPTSL